MCAFVTDKSLQITISGRGPSQFCETSAKVTNWITDPFRWLCETFVKVLWLKGGNVDVSPYLVQTTDSMRHETPLHPYNTHHETIARSRFGLASPPR